MVDAGVLASRGLRYPREVIFMKLGREGRAVLR